MDYGNLLKSLPDQNDKARWIYIVDVGNGNSEVGTTNNLRGTVHRYVTEEPAKSIWISKKFSAEPKPTDPRLEFIGAELDDWQIGYFQVLEFAHRACVNKITDTRFLILPASVVISWAKYCRLGPGVQHIFTTDMEA